MNEHANADLIGYEYEIGGAPFRVVGTDTVLGPNYVRLHRVGTDGSDPAQVRIQNAGVVRRHKQIVEEGTSCWRTIP